MKLNHKYSLWFLFVAVCVGLISLAWVRQAQSVRSRFEAFANDATPRLILLGQLKAGFLSIRQDLQESTDPELLEVAERRFRQDADRFVKGVDVYSRGAKDIADQEFERTLQRAREALLQVGEHIFASAHRQEPVRPALATLRFVEGGFIKSIDRVIERQVQETRFQKAALARDAGRAARFSIWAAVLLCLLAVGLGSFLGRTAEAALARAREQLAQSEKLAALGQFAAGVAHEVKNPLAIIQGGVEFLGLKAQDEDTRQTVRMIEESVTRADTIIRDLLKFARPSAQKRETVSPEELVKATVSLLTYGGALKQVTVETRLEHRATVDVDKNQIQQVLLNVMMNAVDAMPGGGSLTVTVAPDALAGGRAACAIAVKDTGEGIAPEHLSKLFEPFFTTKRDKKGTGLGLSVSKTIVESHGGALRITSAQGQGTTVTLVLPATGGQG